MAELIAVGFDDAHEADRVLERLNRLQNQYLIDLEDAVVAIRQPDGKVNLKQSVNLVGAGATSGGISGMLWGTLVGLLFLNPLAGMAVGGAVGFGAGALSGSLVDYGINDSFVRELTETLKPDSSALFILVRRVKPERVLAELGDIHGHVLRTSLSREQEDDLAQALATQRGSFTSAESNAASGVA